jgi:serine/threonine-protein kinase RsbW
VANAIEHGYRDNPFGMIDVACTVTADVVEVRVADRGTWRGPVHDSARGRGLQLIRESMDKVLFDRTAGTTVIMRRAREAR